MKRHELILENGHKISYLRRKGTGRKLVFFHGFSGDAEGCVDLMGMLPGDYDIIVPDMPGFAASDDPVFDEKKFTRLIEPLHELLSHCFGQGPIAVVGHSYGGMCAFFYAALYPHAVERLVILSPIIRYRWATRLASACGMSLYNVLGLHLARKIFAHRRVVDVQTWYLIHGVTPERYGKIQRARRREALALRPSFVSMIALLDRFTEYGDELKVTVPTCCIVGTKDKIAAKNSLAWYSQRASQMTVQHESGGHLFPVSDPQGASRQIVEFMND